jgi:hypothetical protein
MHINDRKSVAIVHTGNYTSCLLETANSYSAGQEIPGEFISQHFLSN